MISIIFFGTPNFVVPILESIHNSKNSKIIAVVTQPDQPVGRKQIITPSPVNLKSKELEIKIFTPPKLTNDFISELSNHTYQSTGEYQPDLAILVAYGKIIKTNLLNYPKQGFINIHPSLLPAWRGATPTLAPILRGEKETGVTYTLMDEQLDHGPILAQFTAQITPEENRDQLTTRLFYQSANYIDQIITEFIQNTNHTLSSHYQYYTPPIAQNHTLATFTPILDKNDGYVTWGTLHKGQHANAIKLSEFPPKLQPIIQDIYDPKLGAKFLHQACLALSPWPGLWTMTPKNQRLKIITSQFTNNQFLPLLVQLAGSTPTAWKNLSALHNQ